VSIDEVIVEIAMSARHQMYEAMRMHPKISQSLSELQRHECIMHLHTASSAFESCVSLVAMVLNSAEQLPIAQGGKE
jgi:hypothetical protein